MLVQQTLNAILRDEANEAVHFGMLVRLSKLIREKDKAC